MMANRSGTYLRTGAVEGLEGKIKVLFQPQLRNQHSHHHDATQTTCRPCFKASQDGLGPLDTGIVEGLSA